MQGIEGDVRVEIFQNRKDGVALNVDHDGIEPCAFQGTRTGFSG
jgi:hypothetical protein